MNFTYRAKRLSVVDGDTIVCLLDLGFHVSITQRFRLARVNTPEIKSKDPKALEAKAFVEKMTEGTFMVVSKKQDKYGRYVAELITKDEKNLSDELIKANLAVAYEEK